MTLTPEERYELITKRLDMIDLLERLDMTMEDLVYDVRDRIDEKWESFADLEEEIEEAYSRLNQGC